MFMHTLLVYILKATVYSGILFSYYFIALRNKQFHFYNRFYLLMSVTLSLTLPFLNLSLWQWQSNNRSVIQLLNIVVTNNREAESIGQGNAISWNVFALLTYGFITLCLLTAFATGIIRILHYKRSYPSEKINEINFINTNLDQAPFTFFNNLFWKNTIDISDATGRQIFKHELTHIEQKHSWDKLLLRLTTLIFWINPFYWLIEKELGLLHEFIADEKAIENKNTEAFALMLLQSGYSKMIFTPAQSFHYSPIKRRLFMLTTSKKTSFTYARRIMILPLLSAVVLLFAFTLTNDEAGKATLHANAPFTLVVDAGHGGDDAGANGGSNVLEKDINLSVARKIQQLAPGYGISVTMTRTEDKTMSLKDRIDFIKSQHPDACISVHVNVTEEKQTDKNEVNVYITRNKTNSNYGQSRLLGSGLLQAMKNDFPVNNALMQRNEQGIYVLDENPYPAVILECGYMNNASSLNELTNDAKTAQMAKDILQGVVAYANADKQTEAVVTDTVGKEPLYMVDDKETPAADVKKINASTIESINVLKDSAATKKYGVKGKDGVVEIKLKKDKASISSVHSSSIN